MVRESILKLLDAQTMTKFSEENVNVLMKEIMRIELDRKGITDPVKRAEVMERYEVNIPLKTDDEILSEMEKVVKEEKDGEINIDLLEEKIDEDLRENL